MKGGGGRLEGGGYERRRKGTWRGIWKEEEGDLKGGGERRRRGEGPWRMCFRFWMPSSLMDHMGIYWCQKTMFSLLPPFHVPHAVILICVTCVPWLFLLPVPLNFTPCIRLTRGKTNLSKWLDEDDLKLLRSGWSIISSWPRPGHFSFQTV